MKSKKIKSLIGDSSIKKSVINATIKAFDAETCTKLLKDGRFHNEMRKHQDKTTHKCRCSQHSSGVKNTPHRDAQNEASGITLIPIIHDWAKVNSILEPLVGKIVYSKWHRRNLLVKYIKRETMLLMCQDPRFDGTSANKSHAKWHAVYAKEITNVI